VFGNISVADMEMMNLSMSNKYLLRCISYMYIISIARDTVGRYTNESENHIVTLTYVEWSTELQFTMHCTF